MSAQITDPDARPYDARLKCIGNALNWVSICALCAVTPLCQARLPHALAFACAAIACSGVYLAFLLAIEIGKRLHLVGAKLEIGKASTFEDEIQVPLRKVVPFQHDVTKDKALGGLHADEVAKTHQVDVAGRGLVTYWLSDRRG